MQCFKELTSFCLIEGLRTMNHESRTTSHEPRITIFDTTLRDGEQSPGMSMTREEKLLVAEVLDGMGIDVIEAGFAMASDGDFEAVKAIAEMAKNSVICSLARYGLNTTMSFRQVVQRFLNLFSGPNSASNDDSMFLLNSRNFHCERLNFNVCFFFLVLDSRTNQ